MAVDCASCSNAGRRPSAKFCPRCGRAWKSDPLVLDYGHRTNSTSVNYDDLLYTAVGLRALGILLAIVALIVLICWMVDGRHASDGFGPIVLIAVFASVGFFVKSGHHFSEWRKIGGALG